MLVKCRCCGNKIDRNSAYKTTNNGKNEYYCNQAEYEKQNEEKESRIHAIEGIYDIFGSQITNTTLFKELGEIAAIHTYKKILCYIADNKQTLEQAMSKPFNSEYGKIRYFMAILKNNLADYKIPKPEVIKPVDTNNDPVKFKPAPRKKCFNDYINEMG